MTLPVPTPVTLMQLSIRTSILLAEAQMLMTLRMLGLFRLWSVPVFAPDRTQTPAAPEPIRRKTASNVKRPAQRGPGKS